MIAASLSIDLDNQWSYMRTHADRGWEDYPSYLPWLVPRVLDLLAEQGLRITFFVVGRDAQAEDHREVLRRIVQEGHEVGNHSMNHLQWLHRLPQAELEHEIAEAEACIEAATGQRPRGFRGPGFACSQRILRLLARRGYEYDCSLLPTFVGPLARAYYFMSARRLSDQEAEERRDLFGGVRDGLRPIRPFCWDLGDASLLEIPVTTAPIVRLPMHLSYVLYLARWSRAAAQAYLRATLWACRAAGVEPSFLLHPLDFLSGDSCPALRFFPAMDMPERDKLAMTRQVLAYLAQHFEVLPMGEHARRLRSRGNLPQRELDVAP
ncbi:MAG: polysaccharide deacetylase family protein [Myxococcales bacterium]|nr:polysaccharide deacetylase family protein [Myxococcales bacterium]